jgi:hypothetical protein
MLNMIDLTRFEYDAGVNGSLPPPAEIRSVSQHVTWLVSPSPPRNSLNDHIPNRISRQDHDPYDDTDCNGRYDKVRYTKH